MTATRELRHVRTTLGPLGCHVIDSGEPPEMLVVLCHGFGAGGDDLVPLAPELMTLRPELVRARFLFPEAPLTLGGMGWGDARAWWMIDTERFARATATGAVDALADEVPPGLAPARQKLHAAVEAGARQAGLPLSRVALGGFSQGSMVATDLALRLEEAPAALVVFSGTLLAREDWERRAPLRRGLPVLVSHGRQDPLLPFRAAERLAGLFTDAGLAVEFVPFDGVHQIAADALEVAAEMLARALPPREATSC